MALFAVWILVFNYGVSDNIGYSNLEKKYEKTYAYCVRLLDRIEQTPGYYQGIPVAVVGVIGYDELSRRYPELLRSGYRWRDLYDTGIH